MSNQDGTSESIGAEPTRRALLARVAALEAERDHWREEARSRSAPWGPPRGAGQRLRAMADAAPAMLWVTDRRNRCTFLSRSWYEYTGQREPEGEGFGWLDAVHPEDRAGARRSFLGAAQRRVAFSLDMRVRRRDGEYRWVIDEGRPHLDAEGEWRGYVGAVVDVHERRLAIEELRRSEARYRTLFESLDEGFCVLQMIFDTDGAPVDYRFVEYNPAFEKQTGLHDAVGRTARELLPDLEPHWFEVYGRVARTGRPVRFENGSDVMNRWFDVFAFPVDGPTSGRVALLFTDITAERRAAQERERLLREAEAARAEAEAANRTKADFLASMSHELRTPLNAVGGYVDLLELEVHGPITAAQRQALARVRTNQQHLLTLINEILAYARLEAGQLELELTRLDTGEILAAIEPLTGPLAAAKGIACSVRECDGAPAVLADGERVRQVLLNLVTNAIKYTQEGGWVLLSCTSEADHVCLHVRDNGPGIAPEHQAAIFDPFVQVERRLDRPQEGVGLGLAISRDLARGMSGDLTVESTPGEGSTFTLRLPRADEADDADSGTG